MAGTAAFSASGASICRGRSAAASAGALPSVGCTSSTDYGAAATGGSAKTICAATASAVTAATSFKDSKTVRPTALTSRGGRAREAKGISAATTASAAFSG